MHRVTPCSETGDVRVLPILRALTAFFEGQDVVTAGYTLDGRHLANFSHLSFTAPVCCLFKVGRRLFACLSGTSTILSGARAARRRACDLIDCCRGGHAAK